jgi:bacteriorhodopsin
MLTAGLPWPIILYTILLDEIMIVTGLVGALVTSSYKWGYFAFAMFSLFYIAWNLAWVGRKHAYALGSNVSRTFLMCGVWTVFFWFLYPIAWGLSEGGNVIAPDSEAVFYGILDICTKPIFGCLLLFGHRNIDPATLGLLIRDYDEPIYISEKHGVRNTAAQSNVTNGGNIASGGAVNAPQNEANNTATAGVV